MPALVTHNLWLELAGSLFPAASLVAAAAAISILYLTQQGRRIREDWRFGPPWSAPARYLRKLHQEYRHLEQLGYGQQVAFYVLKSYPGSAQNFSSVESQEIAGLLNWALLEKKSLVITGAPRTGKSTFLQALALQAMAADSARKLGFARSRIPFYVSLPALDATLPFLPALLQVLAKQGMPITLHSLRRAISVGRALFLFDGWEEVAEGQPRRELVEWLEQGKLIAGTHLPFIISCPSDLLLQNLRFNFPHFTVALRNAALQKFRTLRAVAETRMPALYQNPYEQDTAYVLLSPPATPGVLRGTKKAIPLYHFHLSKYPVTNRLYRAFVAARQHRPPQYWGENEFIAEELPVVGVDWEDAEAYCDWLNQMHLDHFHHPQCVLEHFVFRLPSEEEWEWAASRNTRLFPWGNAAPTARHANHSRELIHLTPVHAFPLGATPEGVMDLAGNVWEWTATAAEGKQEKRIVRGGAAFNDAEMLRCATRERHAKKRSRFIGFRVVRVPKAPTLL